MELNKTKCKDCGYLHSWYSYKWAGTPERKEWNRKRFEECTQCGSTNVCNHEDDDTMGVYRSVASAIKDGLESKK